ATAGVLVTGAVTAVAAHLALALPFMVALLLGMTIASTDPATLVPILRQVRIRERVAQTVMSESAFNDATGAIGTFAVLAVAAGSGGVSAGAALAGLAKQGRIRLVLGGMLGYGAGLLIAARKDHLLMAYAAALTPMAAV